MPKDMGIKISKDSEMSIPKGDDSNSGLARKELMLEWGNLTREYRWLSEAIINWDGFDDECVDSWGERTIKFRKHFNLVAYKTRLYFNSKLWERDSE